MKKLIMGAFIILIGIFLVGCQDSTSYYTLSFFSNGGSTVSPIYAQNRTQIKEPNEPTKTSHEFDGWYYDEEFLNQINFPIVLIGNMSIYAKWNTLELETYEITWLIDGETFTSEAQYGSFPSYNGPSIKKASTEQFNYLFYGWSPSVQVATQDVTYTALFHEETRYYRVTFVIGENQYINTYAYGEMPSYEGVPEKATTIQYTYEFSGWNKTIVAVNKDEIYVAQFTAVENEYTVTWNVNGGLTYEGYNYGEIPTYKKTTPQKLSTNEYSYSFEGWSPLTVNVTEDVVYTAIFLQNSRVYKVDWKNHDGILLETDYVLYNEFPEYNSTLPTKTSTNQFDFHFNGWSPIIENTTNNTIYIATYSEVVKSYEVSFIVNDLVITSTYNYGETPQIDNPSKDGNIQYSYEFSHWVPNIASVKGNASYTALFTESVVEYTVSFDSNGGDTIDSQTKPYGSLLASPNNPILEGYIFDAWYKDNVFLQKWNFDLNSIDGKTQVLYAKWLSIFEYQIVNNGVIITKYNKNNLSELIIPEKIDGHVVRGLADYSFKDHNEIINFEFEIPENIEYIGLGALSGSNSLYNIKLPFIGNSVNAVGEEALFGYIFGSLYYPLSTKAKQFYNDNDFVEYYVPFTLQSVHILGDNDIQFGAFSNLFRINQLILNDGIEMIGKNAFINMNSLSSLSIPDTATTISTQALYGLGYLESIKIPLNDGNIGPKFGTTSYNNSYEAKTFHIPKSLKEIEITGATYISNTAFDSFKHVLAVTIPNSVDYIDSAAFTGMSSLESLTIPFVGRNRESTAANAYFGYIFGSTSYVGGYSANGTYLPLTLEEVIITDTVRIGVSAFFNASLVKSITLPEGLTTLEASAFRGMSSLSFIILPSSLKTIGDSAFLGMTNLESLIIPDSVVSIGTSALSNLPKLKSLSIPFVGQNRTATSSSGHFGYLFGSTSYTGTYVANGYYLPNVLTEVVITDTTIIPTSAFTGASSITSISLPENLVTIGNYAFQDTGLLEVLLPDSLYSIGINAFERTDLVSINIPSNVNSIGSHAFRDITTLKEVIYEEDSNISIINTYTFYGTTSLISINIPDSVLTIQEYAFYQTGLSNITIPDSITYIGRYSFYQSSLVEVIIPKSVTHIDNLAFSNNEFLEKVLFEEDSQLVTIGISAFAQSYNITDISVPDTVQAIGAQAFRDLRKIVEVVVPISVTSIGDSAFSGMISLESITLPFAGLTRTSTGTNGYFGYIFGTSSYTGGYSANGYFIPSTLTSVTITNASTIVTSSFYNVTSVKSLEIMDNALIIDAAAFRGMSGLESISLPFVGRARSSTSTLGYFGYVFGTNSYTGSYFANGYYLPSTLVDVTITNELSIVTSSFYNATLIKSLVIKDSLTNIQTAAFRGMSALESISLPFVGSDRSATSTNAYFGFVFGTNSYTGSYIANAYYLPTSLKTVSITDTTSIKDNAFYGATELISVVLPSTLTSIGISGFEEATKLKTIYIPITVSLIGANAFKNANSITIYAGATSKPTGWSSTWNPNNRTVVWGYVE